MFRPDLDLTKFWEPDPTFFSFELIISIMKKKLHIKVCKKIQGTLPNKNFPALIYGTNFPSTAKEKGLL